MEEIDKIIATVNTSYASNSSEVKKVLKEKGFDAAKKIAKPKPSSSYRLVYDSVSDTLEPIYFWILDFMNDLFGGDVQKITDNFVSSPGSGHFSELMGKGTRMQEEAMKMMQTTNTLIRTIINLVYDLKDFQIRLHYYDFLKSKDEVEKSAAIKSLKQIWLDNVDIKKGNSSIKAMTFSQAPFLLLLDSFLAVDSFSELKKRGKDLELNDRLIRVLEPRLMEFEKWLELSEQELRKRYNIEKSYLKSQVNSLKLYASWAKPYFKAAEELKMSNSTNPGLVKTFNTIILELSLLGKSKIKPVDASIDKELPSNFQKIKFKRDYFSCVVVDFNFRGVPQKAGQHYLFGGRAEVNFKSYALNNEEINLINKKLEDSDLNQALNLVEGATNESLNQIKEDLDFFLSDKKEDENPENKKIKEDINPFSALFEIFTKKNKTSNTSKKQDKKEIEKPNEIKSDDYVEKIIRNYAKKKSGESCFVIYDVYKKVHGMAAFPG